ncbi:glycosyltransferase [Nocardioides xinjiangensis]|uniref:glycosyltransferase n=1 Tax=Nocardioides xinjiangensis TaxID=2817376 RepID=UPI001B306665|nr:MULTISPECIES: glycosyltransferase [unclassified Nocardioides]
MQRHPLFLSVVCVMRNASEDLENVLTRLGDELGALVNDYEIVVVDNASDDDSVSRLQDLVGEGGLPNIQVYALTNQVSRDAATWMGIESALGDYVAAIDPLRDDVAVLRHMLQRAVSGDDVVFATDENPDKDPRGYRVARGVFERLYRSFTGVRLSQEAPTLRLVSRAVINYVMHHPQPAISYRLLPATGGFIRSYVTYSSRPVAADHRSVLDGFDRGMQILVSTSRAPLRAVTMLSLFGAAANMVYAAYVLVVAIVKDNVEPGWVSVSLQQSGMFFLMSLVLLVLGEYILHMAALSNETPDYHVAREFTSAQVSSRERLNVEKVVHLARPPHDE